MSDQLFKTLELTRLRRALAKIHEQVSCRHGRVEVTRDGCEDVCVILSKAELESLERALEILSETTEFKSMCDTLTQVAAACGVLAPAECEA